MYEVVIKKKVMKSIKKMPEKIQEKMLTLAKNLIEYGPEQPKWPNYSKLNNNRYHCHLSRKWVACWKYEKNTITIEVYYAGSRENAPY
jgi:mRNA-degrading endonuclease RelE of RelBE toxin-antitoxin system